MLDPLAYVVGVDEVLVNGTSVVSAGEHTGARPGQAPAANVSEPVDLRSDICAGPTDEMWEAMRSARLGIFGDDETVNELERRGAELLGKEAAVFVPTCSQANLAAVLSLTRPGERVALPERAHILVNEGDWLTEIAGLTPVGARARRRRRISLCLENTHTRAGGTVIDRSGDSQARGLRPEGAPRRGPAPERRGCARSPAGRARRARRHRRAEPEQGALRPVRSDSRR